MEVLEPRCLLAADFGPIQNTPIVARAAVVADVDGDGIADRISAEPLRLERGVGDGTFLAPTTTSLPAGVDILVLAAGRFRGPSGPVLIAALGHYPATNTLPDMPRNAGYAVTMLGYDATTGGLKVFARLEVPFGQFNQALESPVLLVGDVRAGPADELIVSTSIVRDPRAFLQPPGGRVIATVLAMPADDRVELKATLMDRAFVAPRERFQVSRAQLADVNGDGRTDVLVRPVTAWRAELGPAARTGPASQQGFTRRAIPGSDEAAAGGRFVFADMDSDGRVDRVLIVTAAPVSTVVDRVSNDLVRVMTVSTGISMERGLGGLSFGPRLNYFGPDPFFSAWSFTVEQIGNSYGGAPERVVWTPLVADVDGDGRLDVVMTGQVRYLVIPEARPDQNSYSYISFVNVFRQRFDGSFAPQWPRDAIADDGSVRVFQVTDINGDGRPDLLFSSFGNGIDDSGVTGLGVRLNISG